MRRSLADEQARYTTPRSTFVRGEEILQAWKPRGVSLIEDYSRLVQTEAALADLATTKAVLASIPPARLIASLHGFDEHARLWDALQLWQKRFGTREQVCGRARAGRGCYSG